MNSKIYYFSSSGNSFYLAHILREKLECEEEIDIKDTKEFNEINLKGKTVGLIFPIMYGRIPLSVEEFLNKIVLDDNTYFYVIVLSTKKCESVFKEIDDALINKHSYLALSLNVISPSNYIFGLWDRACTYKKSIKILEHAKKEVLALSDKILNKEVIKYNSSYKLHHKYQKLSIEEFKEKVNNYGDKFFLNSNCIHCGICIKNCPNDNIVLIEGIPVWKNNCEGCMRCINNCEFEAIEFDAYTSGKRRYGNPYVDEDEFGFYIKERN